MSFVGTVMFSGLYKFRPKFDDRVPREISPLLRKEWNKLDESCYKAMTKEPENEMLFEMSRELRYRVSQCKNLLDVYMEPEPMRDCQKEIDARFQQCRQAASLGAVEDRRDPDTTKIIQDIMFDNPSPSTSSTPEEPRPARLSDMFNMFAEADDSWKSFQNSRE